MSRQKNLMKVSWYLMPRFHWAVRYSTVWFGTGNPDQACVSTANSTLYLIGMVYAGK